MGYIQHTLCHAEICSHDKNKLALLAVILNNRLLLLLIGSLQALLAIGVGAVGPVGCMVEHSIVFVNIAFVALDRIVQGAPTLFD
ncbi:unnamed protein product [Fusarium venenatum]|uniref:Uncharacterized protein n=1 Tax=Fusarium venenatum TaxID=56646 RepID=A0A2L2T0P0_9HYPO|nr:uncharacterized protein FVRRES_07504 [Fusarium venenatum]CEI63068.1 unnamed protein product [Fusarium venenatum]